MRVALLTNILTPYRLPVYRELAATPGWRVRFLLSAESDPTWERAFRGAHERGRAELDVAVVADWSLRRRVRTRGTADSTQSVTLHVPVGVLRALRRFGPDVVVSAELGARTALAAAYAAIHRVPLVVWSYQARSAASASGWIRRAWRRSLLARAAAVVGMGTQAREVLRSLGVADGAIFDAPNAHDAEAFEQSRSRLVPEAERAALRAALGVRDRVALVAGRLEGAKGIAPLLEAWRALPAEARDGWTLLFVGDGPLVGAVERAAAAAPPGEIARLPAVPAGEMARLYAAADLLVFPSLADPWGLVVNEALACGLPVACSRLAGCADDLVHPGREGWLFDPTDAADFRTALSSALAAPAEERARLGAAGRDTAKRFGPETMADGLRRAILHAAGEARHARTGGSGPRRRRSSRAAS